MRRGGLLKGGMERGLEAESTSFSRYNHGECTARKESKKEKQGKSTGEARTRGKTRGEGKRLERGAGYIRDFVCLSVRPSEPEGTSAAANLEELGRETNTFAEKRRRSDGGGGIVRIVR